MKIRLIRLYYIMNLKNSCEKIMWNFYIAIIAHRLISINNSLRYFGFTVLFIEIFMLTCNIICHQILSLSNFP